MGGTGGAADKAADGGGGGGGGTVTAAAAAAATYLPAHGARFSSAADVKVSVDAVLNGGHAASSAPLPSDAPVSGGSLALARSMSMGVAAGAVAGYRPVPAQAAGESRPLLRRHVSFDGSVLPGIVSSPREGLIVTRSRGFSREAVASVSPGAHLALPAAAASLQPQLVHLEQQQKPGTAPSLSTPSNSALPSPSGSAPPLSTAGLADTAHQPARLVSRRNLTGADTLVPDDVVGSAVTDETPRKGRVLQGTTRGPGLLGFLFNS